MKEDNDEIMNTGNTFLKIQIPGSEKNNLKLRENREPLAAAPGVMVVGSFMRLEVLRNTLYKIQVKNHLRQIT